MMCKDCKECLNSRLVVSENGYKAVCTLSTKESNNCLLNDKCNFEGNQLYLMTGEELEQIRRETDERGNTINTDIFNQWRTEIVEIRKYYAKCPYCDFSFEMIPHRQLPYFCGGCGRRLRRGEE